MVQRLRAGGLDKGDSTRAHKAVRHRGRGRLLQQDQRRRLAGSIATRSPPKTVREAALKYNGVPNFCGFLAALPADVGVLDPKLGRTRELVKGGHVVPKNVAWLRKHMHGKRP
jgi:hypothetical protein